MSESSTWKTQTLTTLPALRSCSSKAQNTWRPWRREAHGAGGAECAARGTNTPSRPTRTRLPALLLDRPSRVRDVVESDDRHHEERGRSGAGAIAAARCAAANVGFALLELSGRCHGEAGCACLGGTRRRSRSVRQSASLAQGCRLAGQLSSVTTRVSEPLQSARTPASRRRAEASRTWWSISWPPSQPRAWTSPRLASAEEGDIHRTPSPFSGLNHRHTFDLPG